MESRQNTRIKELRAALARGARTPHIAIEGLHLIEEAVKSGLKLHTVFVRSGSEGLLEHLDARGRRSLDRDRGRFRERHRHRTSAGHRRPGGGARSSPLQAMLRGTPLVVIAAGLQDPGNLGTLVRSAEAFGATA